MTPLNLERLIIKLFNLGYIKDNVVKNEKNIWKDDLNITDKYYNFDEETKNNKITLLVNQSKYFIDNFLDKINDITTTATSPPSPIMNDNTNSNKNTNTNKNNKNTLGNPSQDVLNELGTLSFSFELMDDNLQEKYNLTHLPLYQKLITYRIEEAKRKKISQNRVFSNKTIEDIIRNTPSNEQELKNIVGIGEAKIKEFGKDLLKIIKSCS
jgi:superfamily II DNA helicase RecQ